MVAGKYRSICVLLLSAVCVLSEDYCASRSFDYDSGGLAGLEATCADCAGSSGCGFCLSTGACSAGDSSGPLDGSTCPTWLGDGASCPKEPVCDDHTDCGGCVSDESCAWCASEQRCLDLSEIFTSDCHGTIFDAPCPASWAPETRVVGDFILEPDALSGGGHLRSSGATFELLVSDEVISIVSASEVTITGGTTEGVNAEGGALVLEAGDGDLHQGGEGGGILFSAGASFDLACGHTAGGGVDFAAGSAHEGSGGDIQVLGGASCVGSGGGVTLISGYGGRRISGRARVEAASGGFLSLKTGSGKLSSGEVKLATGTADDAAGAMAIAAGLSRSGMSGRLAFEAGRSTTVPGDIVFYTGTNDASGSLCVSTADVCDGSPGDVVIQTGASPNSGAISMETGGAVDATSGAITFDVGSTYCREGADVILQPGAGIPGGSTMLHGGRGWCTDSACDGGGGVIARGAGAVTSGDGGSLDLRGGDAESTVGSAIVSISGAGLDQSGSVVLETHDSGSCGMSGAVTVATGNSLQKDSGSVSMSTGSTSKQSGGRIDIACGLSGGGTAAHVRIEAGGSLAANGTITALKTGSSTCGCTGRCHIIAPSSPCREPVTVATTRSGSGATRSGNVALRSGTAARRDSSSVRISSGIADVAACVLLEAGKGKLAGGRVELAAQRNSAGHISCSAGDGVASGGLAAITASAGSASTSRGGTACLVGGCGRTLGGAVTFKGSTSTVENGGACVVTSRYALMDGHGGDVCAASGATTTGCVGNTALQSGDGTATARAGGAAVRAGTSSIGNGIAVAIAAGTGMMTGGSLNIFGGVGRSRDAASGGDGGLIRIIGGGALALLTVMLAALSLSQAVALQPVVVV